MFKKAILLVIFTVLFFQAIPLAVFAQTETTPTPADLIPVYFFVDESDGIIGIASIAEDLFLLVFTSTTDGTTTTRYAYDDQDNRILYSVNGAATTTTVNKYYEVKGATSTKNIYANGQLVATAEGNNIYYVHADHLTGANVITNTSGAVEELLDYYPFGGIRLDEKESSFNEKKKFSGHEYDMDTQLSYFGARYQDGNRGQFISQDPTSRDNPEKFLSDPQQFNFYSYARNNPLTVVDPTGLYNIKTGTVEKGDTPDKIVGSINSAFGIKTDWKTIQNVSFYSDCFKNLSLDKIVGQNLFVGTNITTDITKQLSGLNQSRSVVANLLGKSSLALFAPNGPWDIKNSSDPILGGGQGGRNYWSYLNNGELIRYDAPGNINYGYVANSLGLSGNTIQSGALVEQMGDNFIHGKNISFSDNSGDSKYIQQGIDQHKPWWQKLFNW